MVFVISGMKRSNSYIFTLFISSAVLFIIFFFSLLNALPQNVLNASNTKNVMLKIFPQGWSFFSKSPRAEEFLILDTQGNLAVDWPNNSMKNLFGIDRHGRAQGIEAGVLAFQANKDLWKKCEGNINKCVEESDNIVQMENPSPNPTLCGRYTIIRRKPVPWAWANITSPSDQPSSFVEVEVKCSID
ncbi:SdpA family antimicrobial peptide system protein [Bacillus changyiensis]|uniref:SdpA family antimicrobial peptide system protein n=1 Tax=Bacillus changyiensis TaxID=3004103 RepID=UPI0022E64F4C|nr:SdpA family antimicrobial peptide system protein [Bacillus changyiensis]MDA1477342.1 SdpA family antimicrobial peptide system protein [Bacillus changyiensis]